MMGRSAMMQPFFAPRLIIFDFENSRKIEKEQGMGRVVALRRWGKGSKAFYQKAKKHYL
jgi:hypothetical protein